MRAQPRVQIGTLSQGQQQAGQQIRGRLTAGADEHRGAPEDLVVGEHIVGIGRSHHRDQVVAGIEAALCDQRVEAAPHSRGRAARARREPHSVRGQRREGAGDHVVGPLHELGLVFLRYAQHHGDQPVRQRFGEFGDRFDVALGDHGVDEFVGDLVDVRLPGPHRPCGECTGDEFAQPGVLRRVGRVHRRQMDAESALALRRRQCLVVAQRFSHIVVARDDPDPALAVVPDPGYVIAGQQRLIAGIRIVHDVGRERVEVGWRARFSGRSASSGRKWPCRAPPRAPRRRQPSSGWRGIAVCEPASCGQTPS